MLQRTGFFLPDIGILAITAYVGKTDPATLTREDLDEMAGFLETFYSQGIGRSLAAGVTFPNSGFVQSEFDKPQFQHKRRAWADFVLRGHQQRDLESILKDLDKKEYRAMVLRGQDTAPRCVFTNQPAYLRVSRDMFPMLNGRGIGNFSAKGEAGLPVSDVILLAIHAMPLGCIVAQGALLAVESDDDDLMFRLVQANVEKNRRYISVARENGYEKYPNQSAYKSHLIGLLVDALNEQEKGKKRENPHIPSLTAYHFSNNGTSARVSVYPLPSSVVQFVYRANKDEHRAVWQRIVSRGWSQDKDEDEELKSKTPKFSRRNFVYEDLFDLPEDAHRFLRTYLLRRPLRAFKRDPRSEYSLFTEADLISWDLTALFLRSIMNMEPHRVDQIRALGDRLAHHIQGRNDRRLLKSLLYERQYWRFRAALLRAMFDYRGDDPKIDFEAGPLIKFDEYVAIFEPFEDGQDLARIDWNLARDLLLIRVFEQLFQSGYWKSVSSEIVEEASDTLLAPED